MKKSDHALFSRSLFIAKLPSDLKTAMFESADMLALPSGAYLHHKGDKFNGIFCLLQGKMKAVGVTIGGEEYSFAHILPGAVVGEIAYLDGGIRTHDACALADCKLLRWTKAQLDELCAQHQELHPAIVSLACLHIRQSFSVVDDFLTLSPEQRLAKRLMTMHGGTLTVSVNQQELGAWIGISRQSINKILNRWQRAGWVKLAYRTLTITQPESLTQCYSS